MKSTRLDIINRRVLSNVNFLRLKMHSYYAFCKFTKIGERTVRQWNVTNNPPSPTTAHLQKISNAFKISINDLVRSDISKMTKRDLQANYYFVQQELTN